MAQNPLAPPPQSGKDPQQDRWMYLLWRRLTQSGQILWSSLDFSGSNLTDLQTRDHNDLQNLNAGDYVHLTAANHTDLTDGSATTLHKHDHGGMDGLADDDHAQYLLASDATNRATFASNWTDLTDGGVTSLHSHSGGGAAEISNLVTATTTINADTSVTVVSYLDISGDLVCSGNLSVT